jgi:hypothetical protein
MENVARDETPSLISADKVEGTSVYNQEGDKLGTVEEIMIDKRSGRVAYAVMSFGGFLGMGESHHPLPWQVLHYDTDRNGYVVPLSKDVLEKAPTYTDATPAHWDDPAWNQNIYKYYNATWPM